MKYFFYTFISLSIWLFESFGQPKYLFVGDSPPFDIHKNLFHFKDSVGNIDIKKAIELQKNGRFIQLKSKTIRQEFGFNTSARWFYFKLNASQNSQLMLELEYNNMDHLELFEVKKNKISSLGKTGDIYNFNERPYTNNNYVFPIQLAANDSAEYYLFINQPNSILSFTIELMPRKLFMKRDRQEYLIWGIYIGIICLVMMVNLVMWLATKDKIYIWYTLYIHFMTMHLFADAGLAFQYLWPKNPVLNSYHPVYLYIWLGLMVQVIFMRNFIHQTAQNSKVYHWLNWFRYIVMACFGAVILVRFSNWPLANIYLFKSIAFISSLFVPIIFIFTMLSLYERRHEREVLVKYYGWAVTIQFIGYLFVAFVTYIQATNINYSLPFDILSYITIGSILLFDILFFSFGLSFRYKYSLEKNQKLALEIAKNKQASQQKIIVALENERKRLSQDLHDDLGATLSTAKGYLSKIYRDYPTENIAASIKNIDQASDELRSISHQLMPNNFEKIGLVKALEESINKASSKVDFEFISMGNEMKFSTQTEMLIFGMASDIISFISRKTTATQATVQLIYHELELILSIEYNGEAIDKWNENSENLHTKALFIKAKLLLDNTLEGKSIFLKIPYNQ